MSNRFYFFKVVDVVVAEAARGAFLSLKLSYNARGGILVQNTNVSFIFRDSIDGPLYFV